MKRTPIWILAAVFIVFFSQNLLRAQMIDPSIQPPMLRMQRDADKGIILLWDHHCDAPWNYLYIVEKNNNVIAKVSAWEPPMYVDYDISDPQFKIYRVKAFRLSDGMCSEYSNFIPIEGEAPPIDFFAESWTSNYINLIWNVPPPYFGPRKPFNLVRRCEGEEITFMWWLWDSGYYSDQTVLPNKTYTYSLESAEEPGRVCAEISITTPVAFPAPTGLSATPSSWSSIRLTWDYSPVYNATFELERKIASSNYTKIADLPANTTSYTDAQLAVATQYSYRLRIKLADDLSDYSDEVHVATLAFSAPSGLHASQTSSNSISLIWNASNDPKVIGYEILRDGVVIGSSTTASYELTGLNPDATYHISIRAMDASDNRSSTSIELTVTTKKAEAPKKKLPEEWAARYNLDPSDVMGDADGDGISNIAEYNLGTNPREANAGAASAGGNSIPAAWGELTKANSAQTKSTAITKGDLVVDKNGAATFEIPIFAVPGIAGMQPQISLSYNSQAEGGIAGYGWSLTGFSSITRAAKTYAVDGKIHGVDYSREDVYALDGQRLKYIGGAEHSYDGAEYRTELETFSRILAKGNAGNGPQSFTVSNKGGWILEFGSTDDSRLYANSVEHIAEVQTWAVSKATDTSGNSMTYTYEKIAASGEQYLQRIDYAGASLRFEYQERGDTRLGYIFGSKYSHTKRLKKISAYYGETCYHTYELAYNERQPSSRSMLVSVTESGSDGKALCPLEFEYSNPPEGLDTIANTQLQAPPLPLLVIYQPNTPNFYTARNNATVDIDGDGRPDQARIYYEGQAGPTKHEVWLNKVSGWTKVVQELTPEPNSPGSERYVDINGDGLIDLYLGDKAFLNDGTKFVYQEAWSLPRCPDEQEIQREYNEDGRMFFGYTRNNISWVDINGDGRLDCIVVASISYQQYVPNTDPLNPYPDDEYRMMEAKRTEIYMQTGDASIWKYDRNLSISGATCGIASAGYNLMDLNGDSLPDIVSDWLSVDLPPPYTAISSWWRQSHVSLNTGTGWNNGPIVSKGTYLPPISAPSYYLPEPTRVAVFAPSEMLDLNNDGLVDMIRRNSRSGSMGPYVGNSAWFNTGNGWVAASTAWLSPFDLASSSAGTQAGVLFVDINNDGIVDCIKSYDDLCDVRLGTPNGWLTTDSVNWHLPAAYMITQRRDAITTSSFSGAFDTIDLDGDGAVDIVWHYATANTVLDPVTSVAQGLAINRRKNPDRLTKIHNGSGISIEIDYAPLTERDAEGKFTVYDKDFAPAAPTDIDCKKNIIGPTYVVKTVGYKSDAIDATSNRGNYSLTYRYGQMRSHRLYGNLGFGWMCVKDNRTNIVSTTEYSQDYPTIGKAVKAYAKTTTGALVSETSTLYGVKLLNTGETQFAFAKSIEHKTYNFTDGTMLTHVTTQTDRNGDGADYDIYGNATRVTTISGDGDEKITTVALNTYNNITHDGKWLLGQLAVTQATTIQGSATLTQKKSYTYDSASGLLLTAIEEPDVVALSLTAAYIYDSYGNRINTTLNGAGMETRITQTEYDTTKRFPVKITNAEGHVERYTYDPVTGAKISYTDINNLRTDWEYDGMGRLTKETRPDGTTTTTSYRWATANTNLAGINTLIMTESLGAAPTAVFLDCWGHVIYTLSLNPGSFGEDTRIVATRNEYDNRNRVIRTWLPMWYGDTPLIGTETTYDIMDRPLVVKRADDEVSGGLVSTVFTYVNRTVKNTNPLGRVEQLDSDIHGRTLRRINNAGALEGSADRGEVDYVYDPLGRLVETQVKRENNGAVITTLKYDIRGRRIEMSDPDVGRWTYSYDAAGGMLTQRDAKLQTTTLTYDKLGRILTRTDADGSSLWTYDIAVNGKGKIATIIHADTGQPQVSEVFTYDGLSRPISHKRTINSATYDIAVEYDAYSRPIITQYPGGFRVKNVYTSLGFLKEIREAGGRLASYSNEVPSGYLFWQAESFTPAGSVTAATLGNGLTYDRIISTVTGRVKGITSHSLASNAIAVQNQLYVYDAIGQVTHREDNLLGQVENYTYDGLNRLTRHQSSAVIPSELETANLAAFDVQSSYDVIGNIVAKSNIGDYTYDSNRPHAVVRAGNTTYVYDANGNMISGAGRSFAYTAANKVRVVSQGIDSSQFAFDAGRQRVTQTTNDGTLTTYVDATYEKTEHPDGLIECKHYILTPFGRTAVRTVRNDSKVETRYYHQDALGSIQAVTDECGQVEMRFVYDAWGSQSKLYNKHGVDGGKQKRGYTDHEMLEDFGLVHMNARLYDSIIGRFISADRVVQDVGNSQTYNRYSYCVNNPVNAIDPTGNEYYSCGYISPEAIKDYRKEERAGYSDADQESTSNPVKIRYHLGKGGASGSQAKTGSISAQSGSLLNQGNLNSSDQSSTITGPNTSSNAGSPDNASNNGFTVAWGVGGSVSAYVRGSASGQEFISYLPDKRGLLYSLNTGFITDEGATGSTSVGGGVGGNLTFFNHGNAKLLEGDAVNVGGSVDFGAAVGYDVGNLGQDTQSHTLSLGVGITSLFGFTPAPVEVHGGTETTRVYMSNVGESVDAFERHQAENTVNRASSPPMNGIMPYNIPVGLRH